MMGMIAQNTKTCSRLDLASRLPAANLSSLKRWSIRQVRQHITTGPAIWKAEVGEWLKPRSLRPGQATKQDLLLIFFF